MLEEHAAEKLCTYSVAYIELLLSISVRVPAWRRAASVASLRSQDKETQHAMAYTADAVLRDIFKTMGRVRTSNNVSTYAPARPQWLSIKEQSGKRAVRSQNMRSYYTGLCSMSCAM